MDPLGISPDDTVSHELQSHASASRGGQDEEASGASKKSTVRKRTKTGCLTCRKRRIKCDEGRPTCNNCLKSKRQCDGYNRGVIFKDPLGAFAGAPYGPIQYPGPSPQALVREQQLSTSQHRSSSQSLQIIAPKPPSAPYHPIQVTHLGQPYPGQANQPLTLDPSVYSPQTAQSRFTFHPPETVDGFAQQNHWRQTHHPESSTILSEGFEPNASPVLPSPADSRYQPSINISSRAVTLQSPTGLHQRDEFEPYPLYDDGESMGESSDDELMSSSSFSPQRMHPGLVALRNLAYVPSMTESRTFSAHGNTLVAYEPSLESSSLNDNMIAQIFRHFVAVTGPSISLYERYASDPEAIFQGQPIPQSRQHIWTYTMPTLAFKHPALLQAILAIASLQMAKLRGEPVVASLKHYHWALVKIAKNVGRISKRAQPANFAATLLLSFYEVWNSDHEKWSKHMLGARWIMKDIPFAEMTRAAMAMKIRQREAREEFHQLHGHTFGPSAYQYDEPQILHPDWQELDVPLIIELSGRDVSYDDLGMIPEELSSYPKTEKRYTTHDFEMYEKLSDLYWWYIKMDVYQSILGGTRLFLEYHLWMQCPPRAPIGRGDAVYGTFDHLCILLGRLSNFAYRDMSRKRKAPRPDGSTMPRGPPPPGMFPGLMPTTGKVPMPAGFSPPRESSSPGQNDGSPVDGNSTTVDWDALTAAAHREWESIRQAFETFKEHVGPDFEPLDIDMYHATLTPFGPSVQYRTFPIAGVWMNYLMGLILLYRAHPNMPPVAMMAAGMQARVTASYAEQIARIAAGFVEGDTSHMEAVSTLMGGGLIECCFPLFVAGVQYADTAQRHWLVRRLHETGRLTGWQSARQIADGCETAWTKAAALGRGPPYQRPADLFAADVSSRASRGGLPILLANIRGNPRHIDHRIQEIEDPEVASSENRHHPHHHHHHEGGAAAGGKIVMATGERAQYALGLLAVEQVLEKLDLESGDEDEESS